MSGSRLRAVTFDAAGTLFHVRGSVGAVYAEVAVRNGLVPRQDLAAGLEARFRTAFAAMPRPAYRPGDPAHNGVVDRAWWHELVSRVMAGAGPFAFEAFFDEVWERFADATVWQVFPEVCGVLADLRSQGLRLAIISNFDARLVSVCRGLGLVAMMDTIVFAAQVGSAKPAAGIFREAVSRLGVMPGEVLHVGDSCEEDVLGARRAGLRAVHLVRNGSGGSLPPRVDRQLDQVADLGGLIRLVCS